MQLNFVYNGGLSKRYHTVETLKEQNIAEHSFGVAWLCELLTQGQASKDLIMAAMAHDLAEHIVGDIPSPIKRELGTVGKSAFERLEHGYLKTAGLYSYEENISYAEALTLKLADMMDGMMFCLREKRLGNKGVDIVFERFTSYAGELLEKRESEESAASNSFVTSVAELFIDEILNEWRSLS